MIKSRKMKVSKRGIYLQDNELEVTQFKPGAHYKYVIDVINKKLIILTSSNEKDNTVSKRRVDNSFKPVIDIRTNSALEAFKGCEYLQVTIDEDKVVIEGYVNSSCCSVISTIKQKSVRRRSVTDISQLVKVKKKAACFMSLNEFEAAAGIEQLTFNVSDYFQSSFCDVNLNSKKEKKKIISSLDLSLRVASFCSGCGLLDKGFIDAGFDVVFAIDIDREACKTYRYNLGNQIVCADMANINPKNIPEADIAIAGTPCQGFSNANRYTNYLDNPKNLLVRRYIELIKAGKYKVFVLENVPQILTAGNGKFINEIREQLSEYDISSGVVSSVDYGSPQDRKRAIIIGSKIGKIELPKPTIHEVATVKTAFYGLKDNMPNQKDYSIPNSDTLKRMSYVPQGGNINDIPIEIRPKGQHSDLYRRLEWDKPSITIVNPRKAIIIHPEENRIISVRECARLFDVPDNFIFEGSLSSMQQRIANSVPVRLANAIAEQIRQAFTRWQLKCSSMA